MTSDLCDEFHKKNQSYCAHPIKTIEPELDPNLARREGFNEFLKILNNAILYIQRHKHPLIASWHVSLAIGTINCHGRSMTEIAQALDVTRQALSKGAIAFGRENGLPPSSYMKSMESRKIFKENRNAVGLKQRIQKAKDLNELTALLAEGDKYENATEDTKRKWAREAAKKRKEFQV